jgi:hypothetical protein
MGGFHQEARRLGHRLGVHWILSTSMGLGEVSGVCQEVRMLGVQSGVDLSEMGVTMHQEPCIGGAGCFRPEGCAPPSNGGEG